MWFDTVIILNLVHDSIASVLEKLVMKAVVLTFGMVVVSVVDADNKFQGVFEEVCNIFKITFWQEVIIKGNSIERYYQLLNKTQNMCGNDQDTRDSFASNIKTLQYAWNTAPFDNKDIPCYVATVGKEYKFFPQY